MKSTEGLVPLMMGLDIGTNVTAGDQSRTFNLRVVKGGERNNFPTGKKHVIMTEIHPKRGYSATAIVGDGEARLSVQHERSIHVVPSSRQVQLAVRRLVAQLLGSSRDEVVGMPGLVPMITADTLAATKLADAKNNWWQVLNQPAVLDQLMWGNPQQLSAPVFSTMPGDPAIDEWFFAFDLSRCQPRVGFFSTDPSDSHSRILCNSGEGRRLGHPSVAFTVNDLVGDDGQKTSAGICTLGEVAKYVLANDTYRGQN